MATPKAFAWQDTKGGLAVIILFDAFITYMFAAIAIDTGRLLTYFLTLVFLALTIGQAVKLIKKVAHRR